MCVKTYMHTTACMWRPEGKSGELALSFHHVGTGDQTCIANRLSGKHQFLLSRLAGPAYMYFESLPSYSSYRVLLRSEVVEAHHTFSSCGRVQPHLITDIKSLHVFRFNR